MKALLTKLALATALVLPATVHAEETIQMKEGLWEMTGDMEMAGQKTASPTIQHCITKKDLAPTWGQEMPGAKCKTDQKITGSSVTWNMSCALQGGASMKMTGKVTYTGKQFSGGANVVMKMDGMGEMKGSMTMSGRYIGACKK